MYVITIVENIDTYDSYHVKNIKSNASDLQSAMKDAETELSNIIDSGKLPCTEDEVFYFDQSEWLNPHKSTDNHVMAIDFGYCDEDRDGCVIVSVGVI